METVMELPSVGGLFFRILASLLVIIILTYFVLQIIKKQNDLRFREKGWIRVLDYQALGPNRGIYLMELLNCVCLVGASEGQLGIIKEIDPEDETYLAVKEQLDKRAEMPAQSWPEMLLEGWKLRRADKTNQGRDRRAGSFSSELEQQVNLQVQRANSLYRRAAGEEKEDE